MSAKGLDNRGRAMRPQAVPDHERWLYENKRAYDAVAHGIEQARNGRFARPAPDFKADGARLNASSG